MNHCSPARLPCFNRSPPVSQDDEDSFTGEGDEDEEEGWGGGAADDLGGIGMEEDAIPGVSLLNFSPHPLTSCPPLFAFLPSVEVKHSRCHLSDTISTHISTRQRCLFAVCCVTL